jgi:hypothetical protein
MIGCDRADIALFCLRDAIANLSLRFGNQIFGLIHSAFLGFNHQSNHAYA